MRIHRFFINHAIGEAENVSLRDKALLHQWRDVFRLNVGSFVRLFDGTGYEYLCQLAELMPYEAKLIIREKKYVGVKQKIHLTLAPALIKKDNLEWVLEKGTELGASVFRPFIAGRTEKKGFRMDRAEKLIAEASEQSGRADLPKIFPPAKFPEVFNAIKEEGALILACHQGGDFYSWEILGGENKIAVFIGPEGGFSPEEIRIFERENVPILSLGSQTLRAETASIAISALILLQH